MDANDPIPEMYYLDVASPGAERPIKNEKALKMQYHIPFLFHFMYQSKMKKNG